MERKIGCVTSSHTWANDTCYNSIMLKVLWEQVYTEVHHMDKEKYHNLKPKFFSPFLQMDSLPMGLLHSLNPKIGYNLHILNKKI